MPVTKSFYSGNSVAVRLPRELGVAAGVELEIEREGEVLCLRPVRRKIDVSGFAGKIPSLEHLTAEERELGSREPDWSSVSGRLPAKS